ncbi:MAG TPA: hypothetical protein VKB20_11880 [Steroidobacteraceae bacterium]|nr:hypothetical protein [Steroidobacteraceae bacterium]
MPFLSSSSLAERPDPRTKAAQPLHGVTEWECPRNGVHVVEVHYSADPQKRDPQWKREAMRGMPPRGWQREFEICWDLGGGDPVLPEYVPALMRREVTVNPSGRMLRGWDFGQVCPATVFAQVDAWGRLLMVGELVLEHSSLSAQIEATKAMTVDLLGAPGPCFDAGDPEALHEMELGSIRRELLKSGIVLQTFAGRGELSYEQLRQRLLRRVMVPSEPEPSPAFLVSPRCPILHSALAGGFARHGKTGKPLPTHPYKDVVDATRYLNDNIQGATAEWMVKLQAIAKQDCAW